MPYLTGVRKKVIELRKANPCMTLQNIGDNVGVSRERVRQLLNKNDLPTKRQRQTYICHQCGQTMKRKRLFCSWDCWKAYHNPLMECSQCHKLFPRPIHDIMIRAERTVSKDTKNDMVFSSRQCQGIWLGTHYGFGRKKETGNV